jgi:hypothetical protein
MKNKGKSDGKEFKQKALDEIEHCWDGKRFLVPGDQDYVKELGKGYVEEIDPLDASSHWAIQPKSYDSPRDLEIIYDHNRAVFSALREIGIVIPYDPFFEGAQKKVMHKEAI